ncbi:MAG: hypothetical protein F4089_06440 [Gammaproteobacteria bacterium]|nr:hypothetical protein [Gammaproteobacteria bacterium]MYJ74750.1 hypothetical protein [Gammaproteobacteria bacterium]
MGIALHPPGQPDRDWLLLQLDWQKAVLAHLASIHDALIARLDVEFVGEPVRSAKSSGEYALDLRAEWEKAADAWEQRTAPEISPSGED